MLITLQNILLYITNVYNRLGKQIKTVQRFLTVIIQLQASGTLPCSRCDLQADITSISFFASLSPVPAARWVLAILNPVFPDPSVAAQVYDLFVSNRIHTSVHMDDVVIFKTPYHMDDGIGLTDIGQNLFPSPSPLLALSPDRLYQQIQLK